MIKKIFRIEGMHCTSCAMNIDGELEDVNGVKESNTSYARQLTEVLYDESLVEEVAIIAAIKKAGYAANPS